MSSSSSWFSKYQSRWALFVAYCLMVFMMNSCIPDADSISGISISDEAIEFAEEHFSSFRYFEHEYQIAISINPSKETYFGNINDWLLLEWHDREPYLPTCFGTLLPEDKNNLFYETIGDIPDQFGYGWDDEAHDSGSQCWDGESENLETYRELIGL